MQGSSYLLAQRFSEHFLPWGRMPGVLVLGIWLALDQSDKGMNGLKAVHRHDRPQTDRQST